MWPKYVALNPRLLDKLELVLAKIGSRAQTLVTGRYDADVAFDVHSGFRTPAHNRGVRRAASDSRHQYGDAADVAIDADGDGRVTLKDEMLVARAVDQVEDEHPDLVGRPWALHQSALPVRRTSTSTRAAHDRAGRADTTHEGESTMNEHLRDRILRKLETLSDERGYQVLDYVEFLESRYAERESPNASTFTRFTEAIEDKLRAGKVSASAIAETVGFMNRAASVLNNAVETGKTMASDLVNTARAQRRRAPRHAADVRAPGRRHRARPTRRRRHTRPRIQADPGEKL